MQTPREARLGNKRGRKAVVSGPAARGTRAGSDRRNSRLLVAGTVLCIAVAGCAQQDAPEEPAPPIFDEQGVVNEAWRILKMATAHDVITLEVEVGDLETAPDVARELMSPLESRYAEALIYVYAAGEGEGGHVPVMRFQWTADGGLVAMEY